MKNFTLDDIRAAADKKYGSMVIAHPEGDIELVNILRLKKEKRKALMDLQKGLEGNDLDLDKQLDILVESLRTVCRTDAMADRLIESVGDDLALYATIFEDYTSETELGEATGSQS